MYLSRLLLNPRSRQVQREIANIYEMHRTILSAFPVELPPDERMLFRLEGMDNDAALTLLVQSVHLPDWKPLLQPGKDYLLRSGIGSRSVENPEVKSFTLHLYQGQTLLFRLRANPTVKRCQPGAKQGRRVGIYKEEEQVEWLKRKADNAGFRTLELSVRKAGVLKDTIHRKTSEDHRLQLLGVQFDGRLEVTDPQKLEQAVVNGIGSAKGFGFGLLSLAKCDG